MERLRVAAEAEAAKKRATTVKRMMIGSGGEVVELKE